MENLKMRNLLLAAITAIMLSACALPGTGPGGKLPLQPPPMGVPHNAKEYMALAASGDLFEIRTSKLLLERSKNPQLRAHAERMIEEHPRLTKTLMAAAVKGGSPPPAPILSPRHANFLNMLEAMTPDMFEITYLRMQAVAHNEAFLVHSGYAAAGENESLKAAAKAAAPVIEGHLKQVRALAMQLEK
jgi:putative membrane protein